MQPQPPSLQLAPTRINPVVYLVFGLAPILTVNRAVAEAAFIVSGAQIKDKVSNGEATQQSHFYAELFIS